MSGAEELHELVEDLRARVEDAASEGKWIYDEQFFRGYVEYAKAAALAFPNDPIISNLRVSVPAEISAVISQDPSCLTTWVRMQLGRLAIRLSHHARRQDVVSPDVITLELDFMANDDIREAVSNDFAEAQKAYFSQAPKATAILCGSAIEGMLVDKLRRTEVEDDKRFAAFLATKKIGTLDWDRASMNLLIELASALDFVRPTTATMAQGVRDFRNTVHPLAEIRDGSRARDEDANVLLGIARVLAEDLAGD